MAHLLLLQVKLDNGDLKLALEEHARIFIPNVGFIETN